MTLELQNQFGSEFEPKMKAIAEIALDVFGDGEKFKDFSDKLALGRDEQIDATHRLANLFDSPIENKMAIEEADDIVDERLRSMWGEDRATERLAVAQKFLRTAFGDVDRANKWLVDHGFGGNPEKRVEMWVLAATLGKNLKD